jgi:hypothetical protein
MELLFKQYRFTREDINRLKQKIRDLAEIKHHERGSFNIDGDGHDEQFIDGKGVQWEICVTGVYRTDGSVTVFSLSLVLPNTNGEIWVFIKDYDLFDTEADNETGHVDDWTTHPPKDFLI